MVQELAMANKGLKQQASTGNKEQVLALMSCEDLEHGVGP